MSVRVSGGRVARVIAVLVLAIAGSTGVLASERYDPRLRFRVLATERFDILYHQGEEALARRLAAVAEAVAPGLEQRLGRPSHRVGVILVNQTDLSNGWATPVPYNLIEIVAAAPPGGSIIGNTDDWLGLVFTHEYTHILHLDRSGGWLGGLRRVFGRSPLLFPNVFLPQWQIEGIATYEESADSLRGRVRDGETRAIVSRAAGSDRFAALDRASSLTVEWPGGNTPYLAGGLFHQYLAERYGDEALRRLSDETARRLPYLGAPAFRKVFGRPLGDLWSDFEQELARPERGGATARTRMTRHGFNVSAPRFTSAGRLFYSVANPHGFPALMERRQDGEPRHVAPRYLGNRLSTTGDLLVFDQLEYVRSVGLISDLYAVPIDGRGTRRLTRNARAADPDVAPDGRTIVCTIQLNDRRALAILPLPERGATGEPQPFVSEPFADFSAPRWSPDGRSIVAERRTPGRPYEIVLIDAATRQVRPLFSPVDGRHVGPSWLPDGQTVLFSSTSKGTGFTLMSVNVVTGELRSVPGAGPGAHSPTVSPDGRTLVYVGYSLEGYDLYSLPLDTARWVSLGTIPDAELLTPMDAPPDVPAVDAPYRPWSTLRPRFWTPVLATDDEEWQAGAATGGMDALGRHAYGAAVAWSASRARPDWIAAYAYDRWRPTLFADVSHDTDPFRSGEVRSTEVNAGALLPFRRVRRTSRLFAALHASTDTLECADCEPALAGTATRRAIRLGWSIDSSRRFGYSISDEEGGGVTATSELTRRAFGSDGDAGALTLDARWYVRAFPRHGAIAMRIAGAAAWGDEAAQRIFSAAGSGPQTGGFGFGLDAVGLLRGFDEGDLLGRRVAVANLDYRVPLMRIERGVGTLPIFLRALHGALFADAGHAWQRRFRVADVTTSFGAELSADAMVGYVLPLTFTTGVAWRDDPSGERRGWRGFARIGRAF